jgi:hypothetical protein
MLNYFKNFFIKLLLLPIISMIGILLMLVFLFHPSFKLLQVKTKHWRDIHGRKKENKDYEAFY